MGQRFGILLSTLMLVAFSTLTSAVAQSSSKSFTAVVELFTSQGCSSCPPADRLLKTYVDRKDVLALSFPVDYWDYLGWKDTYGSPAYSRRQRDYAFERGDGAVYTPQAVVNGLTHVVGSSKRRIDRSIKNVSDTSVSATSKALFVPVSIAHDGNTLTINAGAVSPDLAGDKDSTIWLAMVQPQGDVPVRRGENSGHKLTYYNIVRRLTPLGMWNGTAQSYKVAEDAVRVPGATAFAVIIQRGTTGQIIGAAWLDPKKVASK